MLYSLVNLILSDKNKVTGKTETGKFSENIPQKLIKIVDASIKYKSDSIVKMNRNNKVIFIGDGKSSKKPIVSYCTLNLEA